MTQGHSQHHQQQIALGTTLLLIDDADFLQGFDNGYETCHTYHPKGEAIDTSTFLFLLRNGWDTGHSDQWNTGYIMGWLAAFYEQEKGQLALSTYVSALRNPEWKERKSA